MKWVWGPYDWDSSAGTWLLPPGCVSAIDFRSLADMGPQSAGQRNFALFAALDGATFGVDHVVFGSGSPLDVTLKGGDRQSIRQDVNLSSAPQAGNVAALAMELLTEFSDPDGSDLALPLVPNSSNKTWRVITPGMLFEKPFSQSDAAYTRLRDLLRRNYKRLREAVLDGTLPPDHHRRWLGFQCRKYFGSWNDPRYTEFNDGTVPDEPPLEPTTTVTDDFNRANESLDAGNWTEVENDWIVSSNKAVMDGTNNFHTARYDTALSGEDHYSQCLIDDIDAGATARNIATSALTFYMTYITGETTGDLLLYKRVSGSLTQLATGDGVAFPATTKVECDGSAITGFMGANSAGTTDTSITGNTHVGMQGFREAVANPTFDDFEAADLGVLSTGNVVVNDSTDSLIGVVPQSTGVFYDGTRYWIFYQESGTLKCLFGTSLIGSMSSTDTDGTGNVSGIANSGRAYSIVFGEISGTWYAWGALAFTTGTDRLQCWRWELTSSGLGTPSKALGGQGTRDFNTAHAAHDYGGGTSLSTIFWNAYDFTNHANPNRSISADMTNNAGQFDTGPSLISDAEHARMLQLSDGFVCIHIDEGELDDPTKENTGHLREWRKTNLGDAWGTEQTIESAGVGNFQDQNYATNTSHTGQQGFCQTDDGVIWCAYIDDTDTTNGDTGVIILNKRATTQTGSWSNVSTDVIGSSGEAWHIALTTDGTDLWLFYVKDVTGTRDTAIHYRKYDVAGASFGAEAKLADMQASHTFDRMFAPWRCANNKILVVWSEDTGSATFDLLVEEIEISAPSGPPLGSLALMGVGR